MKIIPVEIKKPLYGNFVYIRSSIVDKAIQSDSKIEVTLPRGKALVDPIEWKRTGKVMKKVFNFPDNPMILYGNYVDLPVEEKGEIIDMYKPTKQQGLNL